MGNYPVYVKAAGLPADQDNLVVRISVIKNVYYIGKAIEYKLFPK